MVLFLETIRIFLQPQKFREVKTKKITVDIKRFFFFFIARPIRGCQHLFQFKIGLHFLGESLFGTASSLAQSDGDGHSQIHLVLRFGSFRFFLR